MFDYGEPFRMSGGLTPTNKKRYTPILQVYRRQFAESGEFGEDCSGIGSLKLDVRLDMGILAV
jgi:hypothetical protein